jgi:hypothetical protein
MFQLTDDEFEKLRLQNATTNFNMIRNNLYIFIEQKVVQVVSSMQNIQDEVKEGIKKIGFV